MTREKKEKFLREISCWSRNEVYRYVNMPSIDRQIIIKALPGYNPKNGKKFRFY